MGMVYSMTLCSKAGEWSIHLTVVTDFSFTHNQRSFQLSHDNELFDVVFWINKGISNIPTDVCSCFVHVCSCLFMFMFSHVSLASD